MELDSFDTMRVVTRCCTTSYFFRNLNGAGFSSLVGWWRFSKHDSIFSISFFMESSSKSFLVYFNWLLIILLNS